jgi:hypothetical protein
MSNTYLAGNPPPLNIGSSAASSQRSAKLLTSTYPLINDAVFLAGNTSAGNLGICLGPNNNNYNLTFIGQQFSDGSYVGATDQIWQVGCSGITWKNPNSGVYLDVGSYASTNGYSYPTSADDCNRLCVFNYKAGANPRCVVWQWTGSQCDFFSQNYQSGQSLITGFNASVIAAGSYAGGRTLTNTPAYKRDVPQMRAEDEFPAYGAMQRRAYQDDSMMPEFMFHV